MHQFNTEQFNEIIALDVRLALTEDVGTGDVTAELIPEAQRCHARLLCREPAVLCGRPWFDAVFAAMDDSIAITWHYQDGDRIEADSLLCELRGPARAIITGERCALNFLQTLSGTATLASRYADQVVDLATILLDTRKTLPGLRFAQKYAVKTGGCNNHRFGLYDAILIKENHLIAAGSIEKAMILLEKTHPELSIEMEIESLDEMDSAISAGIKRLLLDNFSIDQLKAAVARKPSDVKLESSGNVDLDTVRDIALTGVDYISIGGLTKHLNAIDLSMRLVLE
ncbi:MAG: nicotinate-nucleotide diphosphorylase (carboxylating) [Gammaproteobacteria bacterium]|nr:carboxylating nicotinate-nucleotide diphosphorylase [Gammaproteobacteria bacterium]PCH63470.1 MAG: nicotinate-nucleotide diphosphorylase (carboxylating) [Gammaproteobacteria bacterium]PCH64819.1 MAG: nicotinate-nucleotide diphosphorylase (carboxylating) [Gammaproteobacteria bacterium]